MIHGGQTTADTAQAENIINAALFVVRRARYVRGRVTEKYRSKLLIKIKKILLVYCCIMADIYILALVFGNFIAFRFIPDYKKV